MVALTRATVGGADGVSVSLRRHGHLATVAASDQTISDMDASQYATGEGPCVDASVNGRWFHAESLGTETRWPAFTPRAQALGINAILSSPLLVSDRPVGAINIYSRTAMAFAPKDQELASVFAAEASLILAGAGVDVTDEQLSSRRNEALTTRRLIAQAEGVIMEREGVEADDAYSMLCDYSRTSNRPFREWAEDVVASTQRPRLDAKREPTKPPWLTFRRLNNLPTCSTRIASMPVSPTAISGCATSSSGAWMTSSSWRQSSAGPSGRARTTAK